MRSMLPRRDRSARRIYNDEKSVLTPYLILVRVRMTFIESWETIASIKMPFPAGMGCLIY